MNKPGIGDVVKITHVGLHSVSCFEVGDIGVVKDVQGGCLSVKFEETGALWHVQNDDGGSRCVILAQELEEGDTIKITQVPATRECYYKLGDIGVVCRKRATGVWADFSSYQEARMHVDGKWLISGTSPELRDVRYEIITEKEKETMEYKVTKPFTVVEAVAKAPCREELDFFLKNYAPILGAGEVTNIKLHRIMNKLPEGRKKAWVDWLTSHGFIEPAYVEPKLKPKRGTKVHIGCNKYVIYVNTDNIAVLVNIDTGAHWSPGTVVSRMPHITEEEFNNMIGSKRLEQCTQDGEIIRIPDYR
jgi:hypothetical protein